MSAAELREAARLMRERAEAATVSPWAIPVANVFRVIAPQASHANPPMGLTPPYPWRIVAEPDVDNPSAQNARHIASWHPAVALAVADWLEHSAAHEVSGYALAVARAYLAPSRPAAAETAERAGRGTT